MADAPGQISALLHEAGQIRHRVVRIAGGADDDWASWYAQWLTGLPELPDLLGARPVRSELIYLLVSLDKHYPAEAPGGPREIYYARQIRRHFQPPGKGPISPRHHGPAQRRHRVMSPCALSRGLPERGGHRGRAAGQNASLRLLLDNR